MDIHVPFKVPTCMNYRYFLTLDDDFTRSIWCVLPQIEISCFIYILTIHEICLI